MVAAAFSIAAILALFLAPANLLAAEDGGIEVKEVKVAVVEQNLLVLLIVGDRFVPIHVDATVAGSIYSVLSNNPTTRPLSHDLMRLILLELGAKVTRAVITLKEKTYHADLTIMIGDRVWIFDSRSSDAIALALLFKAPIIINKGTWDSSSQAWETPRADTL